MVYLFLLRSLDVSRNNSNYDSTSIRLRFNRRSTSIRPRYHHSTTYVTTVGLSVCGLLH